MAKNVWAKMFGRKYPEKITSQITATICGTPLSNSIESHSEAPEEFTNHSPRTQQGFSYRKVASSSTPRLVAYLG